MTAWLPLRDIFSHKASGTGSRGSVGFSGVRGPCVLSLLVDTCSCLNSGDSLIAMGNRNVLPGFTSRHVRVWGPAPVSLGPVL